MEVLFWLVAEGQVCGVPVLSGDVGSARGLYSG